MAEDIEISTSYDYSEWQVLSLQLKQALRRQDMWGELPYMTRDIGGFALRDVLETVSNVRELNTPERSPEVALEHTVDALLKYSKLLAIVNGQEPYELDGYESRGEAFDDALQVYGEPKTAGFTIDELNGLAFSR